MIQIYQAHPGPYSLMITRKQEGKKVPSEIRGPLLAHAAHQQASSMVNDPESNVVEVYVYSEKEKQFIGAIYYRGREYSAWSEEEIHALAGPRSENRPSPSPRRGRRAEPVRETDATPPEGDGVEGEPPGGPVRDVPPEKPRREPRERFPTVRGRTLELDPGNAESWPRSRPTQIVREWFEQPGRKATVAEVVQALGPALLEVGMQFPAALISRLKQRGFLKESE